MREHDELWLWLTSAEGVGPAAISDILAGLRARSMSLEDFYELDEEAWKSRFGLNARVVGALAQQKEKRDVLMDLAESLRELGVRLISIDAPEYPRSLRVALGPKAPPLLYAVGETTLLQGKSVAVVGARNASERGLAIARFAGVALAQAGLIVVSGGARGTDSAAHLGAVAAGGSTIIVLSCGILRHNLVAELGERIDPKSTLLVSELPPHMTWQVGHAMARNRIVCALAAAVIVVEAGEKGGTMETGKMAIELGRPLYAVEYDRYDGSSAGNPVLLRRGALPLTALYDETDATWRVDVTPVIEEAERHSAAEPPAGQMDLFSS